MCQFFKIQNKLVSLLKNVYFFNLILLLLNIVTNQAGRLVLVSHDQSGIKYVHQDPKCGVQKVNKEIRE